MSGMMSELGGMFGQSGGAPHQAIGNLLSDALGQAGGVSGLMQRANQAGLGQHVQSWIGDGSNLPVSPAEIEKIFPPAELEQFAETHGVPQGVVTQALSEFLPHAVDGATPNNDAGTADQAAAGSGGFDFGGLAKRFLGG